MSTAPFTTAGVKHAMRLALRRRKPWPTVVAVDQELMDLLYLAFDESCELLGEKVIEPWNPEKCELRFLGVPLRLAGEHEESREDWSALTTGERVLVVRLADLAPDIGAWEQHRFLPAPPAKVELEEVTEPQRHHAMFRVLAIAIGVGLILAGLALRLLQWWSP